VPWLDAGARVAGPAVAAIARGFRDAWTDAGGAPFEVSTPSAAGSSAVRVVTHAGLRDAHTLEAYRDLVDSARSHVYVANGFPYVLELQHALVCAVKRGVTVKVLSGHLTPTHDGQPFEGPWSAARTTATQFVHSRVDPVLEAGGGVWFFAVRGQPLWPEQLGLVHAHVHAKLMTADGLRCAVGSANLDVTSSYWESDLSLLVEDAEVVSRVEARLEQLLAASTRAIADEAWRRRARQRSWMQRWPGVLAI
jgi:phosphatidylserine/phosphatidylglycerophosphate/cardiolipin synthase-like enzyme